MPFHKKKVGGREVDFNDIYDSIFRPAIAATPLPEGGNLEPRRTDKDFFAGNISTEMFHYIEYSRFALADISGLNANVFYELGHRHRVHEAGTVIFRQTDAPIPFDINQIKAFSYEYFSEEQAKESRALITHLLEESLVQNRIDSPIQTALAVQRQQRGDVEGLLKDAEDAIRNQDPAVATAKYREAVQADDTNPVLRLKLGLLLKNQGNWQAALEQFSKAVAYSPTYSEAHLERGIAENKLFTKTGEPPDGEDSLRRAVELNPKDFDALASLGGVLKRKEQFEEAFEQYQRSSEASNGHSYPLLNALKLEARAHGELTLDAKTKFLLQKAQRSLGAQVKNEPPYNAPWSFFDLAEVHLYLDDKTGFLKQVDEGLLACEARWQAEIFRDSLQLLVDGGIELDGLQEAIPKLDETIPFLD